MINTIIISKKIILKWFTEMQAQWVLHYMDYKGINNCAAWQLGGGGSPI